MGFLPESLLQAREKRVFRVCSETWSMAEIYYVLPIRLGEEGPLVPMQSQDTSYMSTRNLF